MGLHTSNSDENVRMQAHKSVKPVAPVLKPRNALGDIGNKITSTTAGAVNIMGKVDTFKPNVMHSKEVVIEERFAKTDLNDDSSIMEISSHEVIDIYEDSENTHSGEDEFIDSICDEEEEEETELVPDYVEEIYDYLFEVEKNFRVSPGFLDNKVVTPEMRSVLIDWLIEVQLEFKLLPETLHICVQIIDAYLELVDVSKKQLQLVGVTAIFIASKYEEIYVPDIEEFAYITDNTYTKSEIRKMEVNILKTLNFMFSKPLPLHFMKRFAKAAQCTQKQNKLASYFMDLSLHNAEFSSFDPSYLAACALCLSFKLLKGSEWNRTMESSSSYKLESLWPGMRKIAKLAIKSADSDYRYKAATEKFSTGEFLRISQIDELSSLLLEQIAEGLKPT